MLNNVALLFCFAVAIDPPCSSPHTFVFLRHFFMYFLLQCSPMFSNDVVGIQVCHGASFVPFVTRSVSESISINCIVFGSWHTPSAGSLVNFGLLYIYSIHRPSLTWQLSTEGFAFPLKGS